MADEWYFGWGAHRFGPFSEGQLIELAQRGRILRSDTVWKGGIERGIVAEKVGNLFSTMPAETPAAETKKLETPTAMRDQLDKVGVSPRVLTTGSNFSKWLALSDDEKLVAGKYEISDSLALKPIPGMDDSPLPNSKAASATEDNGASANDWAHATTLESVSRQVSVTDRLDSDPKSARQKRAVALKGAIIANQDGETVQYRKKCTRCGFEDPSRTSRPIRTGIHRDRFFCPKCRKNGEVEIQGIC
jgi:hypothetical protein